MRTARESFLASPDRAEFEKMATTLPFEAACRAALLVYIEEQHIVEFDPNQACAGHHRIMGARKVLDMLREIHLKIEPPKPDRPRQLRPPS